MHCIYTLQKMGHDAAHDVRALSMTDLFGKEL